MKSNKEIADDFAQKPIGQLRPDVANTIRKGNCPFCQNTVKREDFRDDLSRRKYEISGLCQNCQDATFRGCDE